MLQPGPSVDRHAERKLLDSVLRVLQPVLVGVEFLVLAALTGEEDQPRLVRLQPCDIESEGFFREVGASAVDWNADRGSQLAGDACFL